MELECIKCGAPTSGTTVIEGVNRPIYFPCYSGENDGQIYHWHEYANEKGQYDVVKLLDDHFEFAERVHQDAMAYARLCVTIRPVTSRQLAGIVIATAVAMWRE